jgi:hypothetical protein
VRLPLIALAAFAPALVLWGCNRSHVGEVRDALADGDTQRAMNLVRSPECTEPGDMACVSALAKALGSKEAYNPNNPDQAGAAAVALILVREKRGYVVPGVDTWMAAIRTASGPGADAVRLAVALRMADIAPRLGKAIDDEREAISIARAIGTAFPGACATYAKLPADPAALEKMPPAEHPDHSPCVQRDLKRSTGAGAAYGSGAFRALAGALALWGEELNALEQGATKMTGKAQDAVTSKLPAIKSATLACKPKRVEVPGNAWAQAAGAAAHDGTAPAPSSAKPAPSASATKP